MGQMFMKEFEVDGELIYEIIEQQEDLRFHLYYCGIDPGTDDRIPKRWACIVFYEPSSRDNVTRGMKRLGVDLSSVEEDEVDETTDELGIQMMMRSNDDWVTFCDPWLKAPVTAPELENGRV